MNKLCPFPPHPQKGLFCELPNSAETSWPIVEDTFRLCSYCKWLLSHGGCPRFSCHVGEICLRHKPTSPRHPPFIQSLPLMVPFPSPGSQLARSLINRFTVTGHKHQGPSPRRSILAAGDLLAGTQRQRPGTGRGINRINRDGGGRVCCPTN